MPDRKRIKSIVVVGGGAAGWLTAGVIAAKYSREEIKVTLIESPDVRTIGVGEGTWPTMRTTLQDIGIPEADFLKVCNASFKQGSKFVGWKNGRSDDFYYHPFTLPSGYGVSNLYDAWQSEYPDLPFAEAVSVQPRICELGYGPKQHTMPEFAGALSYGYHLDAGKFTEMLRKHCTVALKVLHLLDHVEDVNFLSDGHIDSVCCRQSGVVKGDLFVDCTGFQSLLLSEFTDVPWVDCSRYSINDRAIAVQVPHGCDSPDIASATVATAQSSGWIWDIALSNRRGVGYVYSSQHISDAHAEAELRAYLSLPSLYDLELKELSFQAGYRERFWVNNCVAVGMSAGFIEPLEASALAMVELSANMIADELPVTVKEMEIVSKRFNSVFQYRWQKIIEFLKLHYILSSRSDSDYWMDVRSEESTPEGLLDLMSLWKYRPPNHNDFTYAEEIFPAASYEYVLFGMGIEPSENRRKNRVNCLEDGVREIAGVQRSLTKYQTHLEPNWSLLQKIKALG